MFLINQEIKMAHFNPRPRLNDFSYCGQYAYFVTIATASRRPHFSDPNFVSLVHNVLIACQDEKGFVVTAYCYMPDHLHLLLKGNCKSSNLIQFMKNFKQRSAFAFKRLAGKALWQPSYFDHVLRDEEDILEISRYIWNNPARAGLVTDSHEYPYSGSFSYDWKCFE